MSRKTKSGTLPDPITRKNRLAGGNHMGGVAWAKQSLSLGLGVLLVFTIGSGATTGIADQGTGTAPTGGTASSYPGQGVAATAIASYWVGQHKTLTGSALTTAVDNQTWDPSVKALTEFPSVLNNMAQNLVDAATRRGLCAGLFARSLRNAQRLG
jgi:hypothetical protein